MVLVAEQLDQVQQRGVVEALTCLAQQEGVGIQTGLGLRIELLEHCWLGRVKHAVQPAQNREWQDDASVLALFVVTAQEVGD